MDAYVDPREQLIVELYVRDIKKSMQFYIDFGFEVVRDDADFVVLRWEEAQLYIEEVRDAPIPEYAVGNIRIMVPDVDRYWEMAERLGARVIRPIADKYYGLRDFTIDGPDGLGLRFATRLSASR